MFQCSLPELGHLYRPCKRLQLYLRSRMEWNTLWYRYGLYGDVTREPWRLIGTGKSTFCSTAFCPLIIGTGCRVQVHAWSAIARSVCEWAFGLLAIWCLRVQVSNPAFSRETQLVSFQFENLLPVPEYQNYRKTSSINRTKSQSWNVSCILAQLSSLYPLKPGVKLRMKM